MSTLEELKPRFINLDKKLPKRIILKLSQDVYFVRKSKNLSGKILNEIQVPDSYLHQQCFALTKKPRGTEVVVGYFAFCEGKDKIEVSFGIKGTRTFEIKEIEFVVRK